MNNKITMVTEFPEYPNEITLFQAAGLLPKLVGETSTESYKHRCSIQDPVIRVFSLGKIIEHEGKLTPEELKLSLQLAPGSPYLRGLLSTSFLNGFRYDLQKYVLELETRFEKTLPNFRTQLIQAEYDNDFLKQVKIHEYLYLSSGDFKHLIACADISVNRLDWQVSWKCLLRVLLLKPETIESYLLTAMQLFERAGEDEYLYVVSLLISQASNSKLSRAFARAQCLYIKKQYAECLDYLEQSNLLEATQDKTSFAATLAANCAEKLKDFRLAAKWFDKQNKAIETENHSYQNFLSVLRLKEATPIEQLPKDENTNFYIMTGFPRSGTTLLENALNAHPDIDTCEETSALSGSFHMAYNTSFKKDPDCKDIPFRAELHRKIYYETLLRWTTKENYKVVIDKTPILSASIEYLEKLFPEKQYIFSLRHPYDVVLSNWKQSYSQNNAMAAFNDFYLSCEQYDLVMGTWFSIFPEPTPRILYVRYDDLVLNFKEEVEKVIQFLNLEWTDEVLDFVEHSKSRAVRTPSYANVRKGLTIGVQSSWQNYSFLFDSKCRALLDPWVEKFGYDAQLGQESGQGG